MTTKMTQDALDMAQYSDISSVLVLADSEAGRERAQLWVERVGCRISDIVDIEDGIDRLNQQVITNAVLVDISQDHGSRLDDLLDYLTEAASRARHRSVIVAPIELTDIIAARTPHADVIHLCNPSAVESAMAIGMACAYDPTRFHDVGKGQGTARLQQLSQEVGRIATILAKISEDETLVDMPLVNGEDAASQLNASTVRAMIRARRFREQYFQGELFADPAWDMLLDLMAARLDGQSVAVSSLCIAAAVPATTALRWIKTLTDQGLFVRTADPKDGRRVFIELSDSAAAKLSTYLVTVQRISSLVV